MIVGIGIGIDIVDVARAESGELSLRLQGKAAERAELRGVGRAHVSISHIPQSAVAVVVLEDSAAQQDIR